MTGRCVQAILALSIQPWTNPDLDLQNNIPLGGEARDADCLCMCM